MYRLIIFLLATLGVGAALDWLARRPGNITINWQGTEATISVFNATWMAVAFIFLLFVSWAIFRTIWHSPAAVGQYFKKRRQARGLDALSSGMIAIGAGDREGATKFAIQARKALPNEPLTHLLRAQAAQLTDDRATSRRIYEGMLGSRDTEALGLRGLFIEAQKEGETLAARQFAERALRLNPQLSWASDALFDMQCKKGDWAAALETLASARKNGLVAKSVADRRRAVLLTAQAQIAEDDDPDKALTLAQEAHSLAPNLVTAADIAGRLLASKGNTAKAAKLLQRTWKKSPHPDLALTYAYARPGDSPKDRLERVKALALMTPHTIEAPIALANAAIEAHDWLEARKALKPLLDERLTQRVCTLMARIEAEQHGDAGRVREWLARAVNAPRDPTWTADGITSEHWAPVSPVSGELDAFEWRVPVESVDKVDAAILTQKLEEFLALGSSSEPAISAPAKVIKDVTADVDAALTSPAPSPNQTAETEKAPAASSTIDNTAVPLDADAAKTGDRAAQQAVLETASDQSPAADGNGSETSPAPSRPATIEVAPEEPAQVAEVTIASAATAKTAVSDKQSDDVSSGDAQDSSKKKDHTKDIVKLKPIPAKAKSAKSPKKPSVRKSAAGKKDGSAPADKASTGKAAPTGKKEAPAAEAKIFVPPRAPDDPGTDLRKPRNPANSPLTALRNRPAKGSA